MSDDVGENLLAVAARGAVQRGPARRRASRVEVAVDVDDELVLTVRDDGVGCRPSGGRRSGLRNLAERADGLGGEFAVAPAAGGGTEATWHVPLG